jgi:hypothetical protein
VLSPEIRILILGIYSVATIAISHSCLVNLLTAWQEVIYFVVAKQGYLDPLDLLDGIRCPIWLVGTYAFLKILAQKKP